jgi:hypothetical protein
VKLEALMGDSDSRLHKLLRKWRVFEQIVSRNVSSNADTAITPA